MSRLRFRQGGTTVEMDAIGEELVRRMIEKGMPGLIDRIERATNEVKDYAVRYWPVGRRDVNYVARYPDKRNRPHSRDQFYTEIVVDRTGSKAEIRGRIWDATDYWQFIRPLKLRRGSAIVALVREPLEKKRDEIRAELPFLLPEALRG